jgi:hypothetical protein
MYSDKQTNQCFKPRKMTQNLSKITLNLRYETSCVKCVTPPSKPIKSEAMDQDKRKKLSGL